jgi:hypothetical protein
MSFLNQALEITADERQTTQQAVESCLIDLAEIEKFADAVEAAFPNAYLHEAPIKKSGLAPTGNGNTVPYALKQDVPVAGTLTVYYNGKIVLAGAFVGFEHDALTRK